MFFQIRYNQKRVDLFHARRPLLFVFRPWVRFHQFQLLAKKGYGLFIHRTLRSTFDQLHRGTRGQHRLRMHAVMMWKGYAVDMMTKPFQAWRSFVKSIKNRCEEQVGSFFFRLLRFVTQSLHVV